MTPEEIEGYEVELLVDAIFKRHGYDFSNYSRASLTRRLRHRLALSSWNHLSEMLPSLLHDKSFFAELMLDLSVGTTEMFRDPHFFRALREHVVPVLKTYPFLKVWHAGCATGEEVYSTAILLHEAGLLPYTNIYATDFNEKSLKLAERGIYELKRLELWAENYVKAGGTAALSDYYISQYKSAKFHDFLGERVIFSNHNLVGGGVFGEMHLIMCRNVLIYFDRTLQNQVLTLFRDSLIHRGFLCLGQKESLSFSGVKESFDAVEDKSKIFRSRFPVQQEVCT